jgi:MFS family permease
MKHSRTLVAIAVGILFYVLLDYSAFALLKHFSQSGLVTFWTVLSTPLGMLATLLPGFMAGWFSRNHGIISGFLVGLVGSGAHSVLAGSAAQYFQASGSQLAVLVSWFFVMCLVQGLYSAAAGGTAQLLRSNNSFEADGYAAAQLKR